MIKSWNRLNHNERVVAVLMVAVVLLTTAMIVLYASGCAEEMVTVQDPNDPNGVVTVPYYVVDPNQAAQVELVIQQVGGTLTALGPVFPTGTAIGGILLGALGVWRKLKPSVKVSKSLVRSIEEFKAKDRESWERLLTELGRLMPAAKREELEKLLSEEGPGWEKLKAAIGEHVGPEGEGQIRKMRGLPEKV